MFKNKTKFIVIFLVLILLFSATFVFADNETSENEISTISADSATNPVNTGIQEDNYKKSDVYI